MRPNRSVRADGWVYPVEAARAGTAHSYIYGGRPVSRYDAIAAAERSTAVDSDECESGDWERPDENGAVGPALAGVRLGSLPLAPAAFHRVEAEPLATRELRS